MIQRVIYYLTTSLANDGRIMRSLRSFYCMLFLFGAITQYVRFLFKKMPGFFWPDFIAKIRLCSQSQKVYFFPKMWQKIPNLKKSISSLLICNKSASFRKKSYAYFISISIQLHLTKYYMILFF